MKIILENVIKGARVTGVAKIVEGEIVIDNVAFNVGSKTELDLFVANLLRIQTEFAGVGNGEYVADPIPVKEADPVQEALNKVYEAKSHLEAKIITQAEYDAVVAAYKQTAASHVKPK